MTKFLASLLDFLTRILTCWLPRWKRLTVRARLHDLSLPQIDVRCGDKTIRLFIPDRTSVYWARSGPDCEPMTNAWIQSIGAQGALVDIGANIGLYSLMAGAHGVKRIYAIEPNPFSFGILARNIIANDFSDQITPVCAALNEKSAPVTFKLGSLNAGGVHNEIRESAVSDKDLSLSMSAFAIDDLFASQNVRNISHLKIDVDGLELDILRGARNLLDDPSLISILVEDNSEENKDGSEIVSYLADFGFTPTTAFEDDGLYNKIFTRSA